MSILNKLFHLLTDPEEPETKPAPAEAKGPTTLPDDHTLHKEDYKVIGVGYHKDSLARLQEANPDWRKGKKALMDAGLVNTHIYHYSYIEKPVDLRVDPTNKYGVNRIMVFVAGQHVGYLPEDDSVHVNEILHFGSIKYISARITGGEYRIVFNDGTDQKYTGPVEVRVRIAYSV